MEVPASAHFNYLKEITIELFVKNTGITTFGQNLVWTHDDVWILHYRGGGFFLKAEDGTTSGYLEWDTTLPTGVWLHITATWDGAKMRLYVNGEKQTSELNFDGGSTGRLAAPSTVWLGHNFNPAQPWFNGFIASVRIYNRALTQAEIRHNMFRWGSPVKDGLVLWLAETSINPPVWNDLSGCGNDGTIYGAAKMERARSAVKVDLAERVLAAAR